MKKYDIIYADPAWLYKCGTNHLTKESMINGKYDVPYNAMTIDDMKRLPINEIANDSCLLFMWITSPFLKIGIDLLSDWNFEFSTVAFVWYKQRPNPGSYTLSETELCIVAKKGKIPQPRGSRKERQFLSEMRTEHSKKPDEIRKRIERMFPEQTKIELFARQKYNGWDAWSNEVDSDINLMAAIADKECGQKK
jgi:N6-adenosine-specific RNA methylase IME4